MYLCEYAETYKNLRKRKITQSIGSKVYTLLRLANKTSFHVQLEIPICICICKNMCSRKDPLSNNKQ